MRRLTVLAAVVLAVAACSGAGTTVTGGTTGATAGLAAGVDEEAPLVMAAALEELVTLNHTFGDGPPPFSEYLIQSHTDIHAADADADAADAADADAADADADDDGESRPLTAAERHAIEAAIRPSGPVRWIDDPDDWRTDDLRPTVAGSAILGVGEPSVTGSSAVVPVSLWCGGLCATFLTYRLDVVDGAWRVSGTEGPITIA